MTEPMVCATRPRSTWVPLGDYMASNTDECTATLMYAVNLKQSGTVSFEYIYPDSSIVFEFFVRCRGLEGCRAGGWESLGTWEGSLGTWVGDPWGHGRDPWGHGGGSLGTREGSLWTWGRIPGDMGGVPGDMVAGVPFSRRPTGAERPVPAHGGGVALDADNREGLGVSQREWGGDTTREVTWSRGCPLGAVPGVPCPSPGKMRMRRVWWVTADRG